MGQMTEKQENNTMDKEQLLKNIAELEKQLQGIKSATEQVKTIAGADQKLVDAINAYTANANLLLQSVQSTAKDDVKEVKEAAIREIKATTKDFQKATSGLATELATSVDGIKSAALEEMTGITEGFGKKVDGVLQTIGQTSTRFTEETKTVSDGLSSTVDKLKTFVEENLSEPLDKDLKETVNKSLKPLVKEEMPKAFMDSIVRMENSFGGAQKKIDEDWTKRQKAYDESVKKQQESIDTSVKRLKEQAEAFTATVGQFKTSIEGLEAKVDGAKETTVRDIRQSLTEQADKLNGEIGNVINAIGNSVSILQNEANHTRDSISNLARDIHNGFREAESQHGGLQQDISNGFNMTKNTLAEVGGTLHADNEAAQKDIAGVFAAVKGDKPFLIITIILLAVVIVLQLAPMVLRFLK
jgi:hypothetical protein